MHLLIRAVSLAGQPLTQAISAYFDERGGTIGRSDTNTLALPDPERRISRLQAEVSLIPEGWRILNVGNANPIWHNNRPVPPGEGVMLGEGDELQIGTYALRVNHSQNDETARTITKGRATIDSRTVIASSGLEPKTDSGRMLPEGRVTVTGPGAAPVLASAPAASGAPAAVASAAAPATLPHIPTGFGMPAAAAPTPAAAASPFADLLGDLAAGSASSTPPGAGPAPSSASPFADILGFGASSSPMASSVPATHPVANAAANAAANAVAFAPAPAVASPAPAPAVARLPDDFDPFADLMPATPSGRPPAATGSWDLPAAAQPAGKGTSPFDLPSQSGALPGDLDLLGSVQPQGAGSIDQLFGLGGKPSGLSQDPLADFLKKTEPAAPAQAPVGAPSHVDPLALLHRGDDIVAEANQPVQAGPALPDDVPELNAAMPLPSVAHREPLSASFTFMPPSRAAASAAPATAAEDEDEDTRPADLDMAFDLPTAPRLSAAPLETQLAPESLAARPVLPDMDLSPAPVPPTRPEMAPPMPDHVAAHEPAPVPAPMPGSADANALWTAFCEGAGVKFVPPQGLNPDLDAHHGPGPAQRRGRQPQAGGRTCCHQAGDARRGHRDSGPPQQPPEVLTRHAIGHGATAAATAARLHERPRSRGRCDGRPAGPHHRHHGRHAGCTRRRAGALRAGAAGNQARGPQHARQPAAHEPPCQALGAVSAALRSRQGRSPGRFPQPVRPCLPAGL
ncbi:MAG: FHA domain-containing protein [Aquabacterium sp.]